MIKVINNDPIKGKLFRCDCGEMIWEITHKVEQHKEICPRQNDHEPIVYKQKNLTCEPSS